MTPPREPIPLQPPRRPVPFPVDALPSWAADYVTDLARATQTPTDLAGCCVLGVLAACAGGRAVVEARRGWREPVNLYLLPVMPPGSRKSAVVADATAPLYEAEESLVERVRGEITEATMLRDIAEKAAEKAMRKASNDPGDAALTSDALSAARHAEAVEIPALPRLIADDVTPEAVGSLLAAHGGRLAIVSAEGGVFDVMAGRYNARVPVLDVWLKGHAGDPLRVDRKGRAAEYVRAPALTMLLTVQPAVLRAIAHNGEFRGRGLLARFLYAIPPDNVGFRLVGADPVPEDITEAYRAQVRKLAADLAGWTDPAVLTMSDEARGLLVELERSVEPKLRREGELGAVREWASKLVGATVRIAGLLHLASDPAAFRSPIAAATMSAAARLTDYFAEHAQAAFGLLGETGTSDAAYLLDHLERRHVEEFSIRDLLTDLPRGRFANADEVTAAVEVLVEHGWVIPEPPPERSGPGRKPSPRFRTHPEVTAESAQSAQSLRGAGSADCADNAATSPTTQRGPAQGKRPWG